MTAIACKDIPDNTVLAFLDQKPWQKDPGYEDRYFATWYVGFPNSVLAVMPPEANEKLALAKVNRLIKRGFIGGCGCGCRGDFHITAAGREFLGR